MEYVQYIIHYCFLIPVDCFSKSVLRDDIHVDGPLEWTVWHSGWHGLQLVSGDTIADDRLLQHQSDVRLRLF